MTSRFWIDQGTLMGFGHHGTAPRRTGPLKTVPPTLGPTRIGPRRTGPRSARGRALLTAVALLLAAAAPLQHVATSRAAPPPECNEALRTALSSTQLPDCRAYEMVTPPYKEGVPLSVRGYASDGESAILGGLATLAENPGSGESAGESALYRAIRTPSGWQLAPLNPQLSQFVGQIPLAAEANDGETLWDQHPPDQPASSRGLYVRSASGTYSLLGPLSPHDYTGEEPSNTIDKSSASYDAPVAATSDYGHVLLEAADAEDRWPFDLTAGAQASSLYEYSGTGNATPTLVGVSGEKTRTSLIGLCGTTLGSAGSASAYNALSADGETVFFTVAPCATGPQTAEIYARLHGDPASPAPAETIHVSASECTEACGTRESGKNFEGASENGGLVYFTSTQKLTDSAVDGTSSGDATTNGCAQTQPGEGGCNLYVYDLAAPGGARLKAVSSGAEVLGVMAIAEDGTRVYYASRAAVPSAGENPYGQSPLAGEPNVYVYDDASGATHFIATLDSSDSRDWSRTFGRPVELAGEGGRFLLFASSAPNLTPDDTGSQTQLFEYKAPTGDQHEEEAPELVRISRGEAGFDDDGNGVSTGVALFPIESVTEQLGDRTDFKSTTNRSDMSTDGRTVLFATAGQLSPRATSAALGCDSVYEFRTTTEDLAEGEIHLVSDGRDTQLSGGTCGAELQAIDAGGANVLFSTADPLLAGDTDGVQRDTYDARVGGGFAPSFPEARCGFEDLCAGTPGDSEVQPASSGEGGNAGGSEATGGGDGSSSSSSSSSSSEAPGGNGSPQTAAPSQATAGGAPASAQAPAPPATRAAASAPRPARATRPCGRRSRRPRGVCGRSAKRRARSARRRARSARGASESKGGR